MEKRFDRFGNISKRTWNILAEEDAEFYVLTDEKKRGKWNINEFLDTGKVQWNQIKKLLIRYEAYPQKGIALDIGCGTGRIALAMSNDFEKVVGVDVSEVMIEKANRNKETLGIKNIEFIVNNGIDLTHISNESVDFVLSYITLQHCPSSVQVLNYINEFSRVLKPKGVAFFQFRVFPTFSIYHLFLYLKFIVGKITRRLLERIRKKIVTSGPNYDKLDAFRGNWIPYNTAYKVISRNFRHFYCIQTPIELYEDRFWQLNNEFERWKRSFWLCIK